MQGNDKTFNEHPSYYPPELLHRPSDGDTTLYHCYVIGLVQHFTYDVSVHDMVLALRIKLDDDVARSSFDLEDSRGVVSVNLRYVGMIHLSQDQVLLCRKFQATVLHVLLNHTLPQLDDFDYGNTFKIDYLLLPSGINSTGERIKDWRAVISVLFTDSTTVDKHIGAIFSKDHSGVMTKDGIVCSCMLENSLVYTPHNDLFYCITGFYDDLNANSHLKKRAGKVTTYKEYYEEKSITLNYTQQKLLRGRHIFTVQNCLHSNGRQKERDPNNATVELPPELCSIIMSPIPTSTLYSFSFVPSIMHRVEALLIASNLKRMHLDHQIGNFSIPSSKILEAITTKHCQEKFDLESLETLGDSFLKYAVSQQLFMTHQNFQEGKLHAKKEEVISNARLWQLGFDRKLPGFIHDEKFDPKKWVIPGGKSESLPSCEELLPGAKKMYVFKGRKLKNKTVADAVEALLGVYVSIGGDFGGLQFINWLGLKIDFVSKPYRRNSPVNPEEHLNVKHIESLLNYSFHDPSLLVEALTHGSYVPGSYQRLEFLGDAVLDYLITIHLYLKYPGMSPEILTDLRSASVNNDCYARSAVKDGLHEHILLNSPPLDKLINETINNFDKLSSESMFGWESETSFPKVLADIIESIAGAILVDSGYNKETVFRSIIPLLEPLVTPETVKVYPVRELTELCQTEHYTMKEPSVSYEDGVASVTMEVEARRKTYKHTSTAANKKTAEKLAAKELLKKLKAGSSSGT